MPGQQAEDDSDRARLRSDLRLLSRRARLVGWAISLCTTCSLFVSLIIVSLFMQALFDVVLHGLVPVFFILGMTAFILGLLLFLREIYLATAALRIGPPDNEGS